MASRGLGTLTLDLVAKIGGFVGPLSKAERELDKRTKAMQARATAFGKVLGGALVAGAGAAVTGLAVVTKQAIDAADRINDISQRLGVGTEALSAWGYAAQQSGTDIEALNGGLTRFTKNVAAAVDSGSRQGQAFEALGISVKDAAGNLRSVESLLPEVAQAFKQLDNATLEAALAQELFGRSGANLLQFLNLGSDGLSEMEQRARELGIVITQDTASAADEFNDQLANLKALATGAGLQLAQELLPALTDLVVRLREALQEGEPLAKLIVWIGDQAQATAKDFDFMAGTVRDLTNMFGGLYDGAKATLGVLKGIATLDWDQVKRSVQEGLAADQRIADGFNSRDPVRRTGPLPSTGLEGFFPIPGTGPAFSAVPLTPVSSGAGGGSSRERQLMDFFKDPTGTGGAKSKKAGKSDAQREAEQLAAAYQRMNDSLAEQIALFGQASEAARVRYEVEHGELVKLSQAEKDSLIAKAEKLDLMRDEAEVQKALDEANKRHEEAVKEGRERTDELIADMRFELELMTMTNDERARAIALRYADAHATEAQRAAIGDLAVELERANEQTAFMDDFRASLADTFTDVVTGAKSAKEAFKDFFDDLAARITQMIAERWIEKAFGAAGTTGKGTAGGDWLGALFGALFGGGRATGGGVQPGMFYQVNENGPELLTVGGRDYLMMGAMAGNVSPNRGGGLTQTNNIIVQGRPDRRTTEQIERAAGRGARRGMARTG